ncbi:lipocalin family protein [Lutibacter sp. B1]|uniref:lipocalin family protein n=1 Tax=Lutibacter sp. B1 TaxID=2725996 RepID=UPI00145748AA|nr:lipocalin family protein [Lutibacter sp. B1]NLP59361.1 hypothetical protein [Lutibacter sp. B1]
MRKLILIFLISGIIFSCEKDDDNNSQEQAIGNIINPSFNVDLMIGAWVNETIIVNGNQEISYEHNPNCTKDVFGFFNTDIRPFTYEEIIHINNDCGTSQVILDWKVNENILSFYFGEQLVLEYEVLNITDTEFTVLTSDDYNNDGTIDTIQITAKREDPYGWFE